MGPFGQPVRLVIPHPLSYRPLQRDKGLRRRTKCEEAYTSGVHDLTRFWAGGRRPGKP